ncbi:MAG: DinB family protein [Chloroflexi bacterium]|nr:MAG: DinB family protein [Chloroflexota bacterium]
MSESFAALVAAVQLKMNANHDALREVVRGLSADALNWQPAPETNSICALVSHALDAERFLLATTLDHVVARDRESHFRATTASAADLLALIDRAVAENEELLSRVTEDRMAAVVTRPGRTYNGAWWLLQAVEHTREHIGHAQLTRQLWEAR